MPYLIQVVSSGEVLGAEGELLPVWKSQDKIAYWPSKLATHIAIEEWLKDKPDYFRTSDFPDDCFRVTAVPKEPGPPLVVPECDPVKLLQDIYKAHCEFWNTGSEWVTKVVGVQCRLPSIVIDLSMHTWAGQYDPLTHECRYPLAYPMMVGMKEYSKTIAHEVAHSLQNPLHGRGASHGNDFYMLMKHALNCEVTRHTHSYDMNTALLLNKSLIPWYKREIVRGTFATSPCPINTNLLNRRGDEIE